MASNYHVLDSADTEYFHHQKKVLLDNIDLKGCIPDSNDH